MPRQSLLEKNVLSLAMEKYIDLLTGQQITTHKSTNDSTWVCGSCGRTCKNEKGLKIHRNKMGCSLILKIVQHSGQPHETDEGRGRYQVTATVPRTSKVHLKMKVTTRDWREFQKKARWREEGKRLKALTKELLQIITNYARKEQRIKWPTSSQKKKWQKQTWCLGLLLLGLWTVISQQQQPLCTSWGETDLGYKRKGF